VPPVSRPLLRAFAAYSRWYLGRHFHAIRLLTAGWLPLPADDTPTIVFLNHASWWDPLTCLHLWNCHFPTQHAYAPIDATAVAKYAFFRKLGFFGVEADSARGAAEFLRIGRRIASHPHRMLWVTPQARFADARERPLRFKPGLGHLASRIERDLVGTSAMPVRFLPLAIEYTHWHERLPELLLHLGAPVVISPESGTQRDAQEWTQLLEGRLASTMETLGSAAQRRDASEFENLLRGSAGVGGVYDFWRHLKAAVSGRRFTPRHGNL
jgi:1-acyl-sn-glycerol-3-phosphate acyltransferase